MKSADCIMQCGPLAYATCSSWFMSGFFKSKKRIGARPLKISKHRRKLSCGDILLTAAFVSYFGTCIKQHHQDPKGHFWITSLKAWTQFTTLRDDATAVAWSKDGDRMSTDNTTLLTNCALHMLSSSDGEEMK
ncbi:dynein axonemal heavy chain 11 isoform X2 [Zonotrichia albicollis]|uniref:dynein axonemal heavy chain 11 isoform X2 n=1 Tax=Zonotrichia albicollis TaxID=44394 RepID=UPI003D80D26B